MSKYTQTKKNRAVYKKTPVYHKKTGRIIKYRKTVVGYKTPSELQVLDFVEKGKTFHVTVSAGQIINRRKEIKRQTNV